MAPHDEGNGSGSGKAPRPPQVWYAIIVDGKLYGIFPHEEDARSIADSFDPKRGALIRPVMKAWELDLP